VRGLVVAGGTIAALGYQTEADDTEHAIEIANKTLDEATQAVGGSAAQTVADLIGPFIDSLETKEDAAGVTTGWQDVDAVLSRLRPGQLITIGARPGVGKSVAMVCLAHHVGIRLGRPVLASTLEMSSDEYMARLVSLDARVDLKAILDKNLNDDDWKRISDSYKRLSEAGTIVIDDTPTMGVAGIRASLREMRRRGTPAALTIVDYLQLMSSGKRVESRQVEVSEFSRSLKILAKEFRTPVVIGSQLNRNVEHRQDKQPNLSDLRESGSIEQDSDVVILLHREDAYDPETPRAGEIDLFIEKNRNGPKSRVTALFQGQYSRIVNFASDAWSPMGGLS
jgi:replicative DNA helicase